MSDKYSPVESINELKEIVMMNNKKKMMIGAAVAVVLVGGGTTYGVISHNNAVQAAQVQASKEAKALTNAKSAVSTAYKTRVVEPAYKAIDGLYADQSKDYKFLSNKMTTLEGYINQDKAVDTQLAAAEKTKSDKDVASTQLLINKETASFLLIDKTNDQKKLNSLTAQIAQAKAAALAAQKAKEVAAQQAAQALAAQQAAAQEASQAQASTPGYSASTGSSSSNYYGSSSYGSTGSASSNSNYSGSSYGSSYAASPAPSAPSAPASSGNREKPSTNDLNGLDYLNSLQPGNSSTDVN
jgi:hypothetical protein